MIDKERILEALKIFNGNNVILYNGIGDETVTFQDVVDYVIQLQNENERLNDMEFTQEHCDLYSENEFLKAGLRDQQAEIERLTEERKTANKHDLMYWFNAYKECNEDCEKYAIENAELQKQVGELKNKCCEISYERYEEGKRDTAKEILQSIMNIIKKSDGFLCEEVIRIMAKQYGVEVE